MQQNGKGQLSIAACSVLWSTSGLFIKIIPWHPMVIAGFRSLFAALFMIIVSSLGSRLGAPPGGRKKWKKPRLLPFWGAGACYAITMTCFTLANKLTTSANAILLQYSAPIWAAIFGWILAGEKPLRRHWLALVAVILGMLLIFKDGLGGGAFTGDLLAIISGVTFGLYSVLARIQGGNPNNPMILSHLITAAIGVPFIFAAPPALSTPNILAILFLGLIQSGAACTLFSYGIQRVSAVQAMLIAGIEPVFNPVWVLLATGERPTVAALLGGGIIVAAVVLSSVPWGKKLNTA
jgi:drug/metabolite transporter (DMT)-like permease